MSNKKISRFSSMKPEDIAWRVEQAEISGQIEGIERDPILKSFVQQMDDDGISIEEQIARLKARAMSELQENERRRNV